MQTLIRPQRSTLRLGSLCVASAMLSLSAALAAAGGVTSEIQARYEQERANCLSGASNQDRATCLKEANNARDAAKRGQLSDGGGMTGRNAKLRCEALTGDEARDCLARMKGKGTTSGSVEAGGIYRETVTREVKPTEPAASAP